MSAPVERSHGSRDGAFPTTRWSVVLNAGADSASQAHAALETLCTQYWYPLYAFVRRQGRTHAEAEDCTQEFLAQLLANAGIPHARPERGRFRTFLLAAVKNFLANEWHRTQAAKRGGGQILLSLDLAGADERFACEPVEPGCTPEQAFDRSWALGLLERATETLREDYAKSDRAVLFAELAPQLWGHASAETLDVPAARLGMTAAAFTVALHRLRRRLGEKLRALVAETVRDPADVDGELRYLIEAVGGKTGTR